MTQEKDTPKGVIDVRALYMTSIAPPLEDALCHVVREDALTLEVEDIGFYTLMWTSTADDETAQGYTLEDGLLGDAQRPEGLALAMGFALSEGLITSLADIRSVAVCPDDPAVVKLQLKNPQQLKVSRKNVVINSSCSICGPKEILQENALGLKPVADSLRVEQRSIPRLMETMSRGQPIFEYTGGTHAAAIFAENGDILAIAEDLGRHNALDKAIGMVLLQRGDVSGCGVVLSSRLSLEMVVKALRCKLQIMLAVSAPTSLAIDVAQKFGITLCGFVRESRATVFTHPHRIIADAAPAHSQA